MYSRPRFNRGTSVIAALVFAALLGAVALGLNAFQTGSTNTVALPAASASAANALPADSSDQMCQSGQDYDHTLPTTVNLPISGGEGVVPSNIDVSQTDVTETVCLSDADATAVIKGKYAGQPVNAMPTSYPLPPGTTGSSGATSASTRISCKDNSPTTSSAAGVCTYTKQVDGTYKLQNWSCGVRVYAPGVPQCKIYSVPLGGNVSSNAVLTAAGGAQVYGSTGITPTIPPSLQSTCQTTSQAGTITCAGSDLQSVQSGLPGYNCSSSSTQDEGTITCTSLTAGQSETSASSNLPPNPDNEDRFSATSDQTQPVGAGINCDQNPTQCPPKQSSADQQTDQNTYCYDNGTTCYPPDSQIQSYKDVGWTCKDDGTGVTACTSSPTANGICPNGNCTNNTAPVKTGTNTNNGNNSNGNNTLGTITSGLLKGLNSTLSPQNQGGLQNTCSGLSSLLGICSNNLSCQLSISPNPPQQGMPANLTWTSSGNVYQAQISGVGNVGPSGSYTVYPNGYANYTMTVYGQNNSGTGSCNTTVNASSGLTGCTGTNSCASSQTPYGVGTNGQACSQPPPVPATSSCTTGTWQPVSAANNGCVTSYQCGGQTTTGQPTAQLSCSPQVADVGMSVALSYSCANSTGSTAAGFSTDNQTSGSTTTVITTPPSGTNTANFGLTCTNGTQATGAQCSVQINRAAIVLVANPKIVPSGQPSSIGWVTAGMSACVISSPQDPAFTSTNASNQSVNGVAQTGAITGNEEFDLTCTTLGGQTRIASTTVSVSS